MATLSARSCLRLLAAGPTRLLARARWRLWTAYAWLKLREGGGRLQLVGGGVPTLVGFPRVDVSPYQRGRGTFRLALANGVRIGRGVVIELETGATTELRMATRSRLGDGARLQLRGGRIEIGQRTYVRAWTLLKSDGELRIGAEVVISYFSLVHCTEAITIADQAALAERVSVLDSDHSFEAGERHWLYAPLRTEPVIIGHNSFVGAGCTVLRGARVGRSCVIAANSVLTRGIYADGHLVAGNPAAALRALKPGSGTG